MDGNSAATGNMLPMATLRPRNETEHETVLAEQNTEHFTRTSPSQRTLIDPIRGDDFPHLLRAGVILSVSEQDCQHVFIDADWILHAETTPTARALVVVHACNRIAVW